MDALCGSDEPHSDLHCGTECATSARIQLSSAGKPWVSASVFAQKRNPPVLPHERPKQDGQRGSPKPLRPDRAAQTDHFSSARARINAAS